MRRVLLAFVFLTACMPTAPDGPDGPGNAALVPDEILTTPLDAAPATEPEAQAAVRPVPRPEVAGAAPTVEQPQVEPAVDPAVPKSAEQTLCEKTGGTWAVAGKSGAFSCVKPTRDAGKSCSKQKDCQGMCLARSGTCAPFMPLFGCNEILDKEGRRVTLCID